MTSTWVGAHAPEALAAVQVADRSGVSVPLGTLWAGRPTLILFLRHFGCIGCSEELAVLRPCLDACVEMKVGVVFVGCGSAPYIDGFVERQRLVDSGYEIYTDPSLDAHRAAMLHYGRFRSLGPRGLFDYVRAYVAGHVNLDNEGDPRQQAGAIYLDRQGKIRFYHRNESLGDHPPAMELTQVIMQDMTRRSEEERT